MITAGTLQTIDYAVLAVSGETVPCETRLCRRTRGRHAVQQDIKACVHVCRLLRIDLPQRGCICCSMDNSDAGGTRLAAVQPLVACPCHNAGCGSSLAGE
jgi:hypothetical protein